MFLEFVGCICGAVELKTGHSGSGLLSAWKPHSCLTSALKGSWGQNVGTTQSANFLSHQEEEKEQEEGAAAGGAVAGAAAASRADEDAANANASPETEWDRDRDVMQRCVRLILQGRSAPHIPPLTPKVSPTPKVTTTPCVSPTDTLVHRVTLRVLSVSHRFTSGSILDSRRFLQIMETSMTESSGGVSDESDLQLCSPGGDSAKISPSTTADSLFR